ncbi:hypothetical protein ABPG74_021485 [Tetrahymena malaccensis]
MSKKDLKDVNWQSQISELEQQQQQQNSFDSMIPSIQKLLIWLIYITGFGMIIFPYFALTLDPKFAIHFWILTGIDFGLFVALLNFKRFVVSGNTLQQNDEIDDKKQDVVSSESNNSSKKQQNQQKKIKKNN